MRHSCTIVVKVLPNAPRNEIVGWLGDALKVRIHAPPVEGRANDALCEFIADRLGRPRRAVSLLRGESSRQKVIAIAGLSRVAFDRILGLTPASSSPQKG